MLIHICTHFSVMVCKKLTNPSNIDKMENPWPEIIANSDWRHGFEFDCNQEDAFPEVWDPHRLQLKLQLAKIASDVINYQKKYLFRDLARS